MLPRTQKEEDTGVIISQKQERVRENHKVNTVPTESFESRGITKKQCDKERFCGCWKGKFVYELAEKK